MNYFGQDGELRGCINDVRNLTEFLTTRYGYKREDMVLLTDDQRDLKFHPTRENILSGMRWLVDGAQPNDSLFLHFSGEFRSFSPFLPRPIPQGLRAAAETPDTQATAARPRT